MTYSEIVARARARWAEQGADKRARVVVGAGTCGLAVGAREVVKALHAELAQRGSDALVTEAGCSGLCSGAVSVDILKPGRPRLTYLGIRPQGVSELVARSVVGDDVAGAAVAWADAPLEGVPSWRQVSFWAGQTRRLMADCGVIDPCSIEEYIVGGGYRALARALGEMGPEGVIAEVKASELSGRGGAYFPAGFKWESCRRVPRRPKYLVVNAEEGEPGINKDRHLMEGNPHLFLEGIIIAAYAIGVDRCILYLNSEAHLSQERLAAAQAQAQAQAWGLLGDNILGSDFSLHIETRLGMGGYVLGDASSLQASIEGDRSAPRVKLARSVESGVFGRPTVTNNVETLANVPLILEKGARWFFELGGEKSKGTKLLMLGGNVANPGLVEVPFGSTLRHVVEGVGGGIAERQRLRALLTGGPSGTLVPPSLLDLPLDEAAFARAGLVLGSGGIVALDESRCIVDVARILTAFNAEESCGKCTPCREGTQRQLRIVERICAGRGNRRDLEELSYLSEIMVAASLCGLGQMAPNPVASALRFFPDEFVAHVKGLHCPTGVCGL